MSYYLQDNPNPNTPQFGWPRKKVSGVIGVHTAENNTDFTGADPGAEDVARFIGRRADYGSYHAIADADSRIKLVHPSYAAWADTTNNAHGMSVSGAMQAARWRELTPERAAALTRNMAYAAAELVRDAIAAGLMSSPTPARRITPAEAIAGSKAGFYGHGETNPGRRYDPGQNFDWTLFLQTYAAAVGGSAAIAPQSTTTTPKGFLMALTDEKQELMYTRIERYLDTTISSIPKKSAVAVWAETVFRGGKNVSVKQELADAKSEAQALRAVVGALAKNPDLSADQITAAVKAGLAAGVVTVDVNVNGASK